MALLPGFFNLALSGLVLEVNAFRWLENSSRGRAQSAHRLVLRDFAQGFGQKLAAGLDLVPGRCTGWMRQRDKIDIAPGATNTKRATDYVLQFRAFDELSDGEASYGNDQPRFENRDFFI